MSQTLKYGCADEVGEAGEGDCVCRDRWLWAGGVPRDALDEGRSAAERGGGEDVFVDAVADDEYLRGAQRQGVVYFLQTEGGAGDRVSALG